MAAYIFIIGLGALGLRVIVRRTGIVHRAAGSTENGVIVRLEHVVAG